MEDLSSSESSEEEMMWRKNVNPMNYPMEYWEVQKLIKYLQIGNPTVTLITLCSIIDFDLKQDRIQLAFRDAGGINTLINILETEDPKCKMGALKILRDLCTNQFIRRSVVNLGGLKMMAQLLKYPDQDLQCLAAECLANVVKFSRARKIIKQEGALENLVSYLNPNEKVKNWESLACCGAKALWSCCQSLENMVAMRKAGVIPFLVDLIKLKNRDILVPVTGILEECVIEKHYKTAVKTQGMLEYVVKNLNMNDLELQRICSSVIQKCAEDEDSRELVRVYGGLEPLVNIAGSAQTKDLLASATGAIWKCSMSPENVIRFQDMKSIDLLVSLLNNQPEKVLINVVGALAEFARSPSNRTLLRKANGIPPLVLLLSGTNDSLLINVANALGRCAEDSDCMMIIDKLDGVRLLWSLLKNNNKQVQVSAAWALCPCIKNVKDPGEMVRSFVGGLELIVSLLKPDNLDLLTAVCACIAEIAQDKESLAVLTDHGVVSLLSQLSSTEDLLLRYHLAEAIACCCGWNNNRAVFGEEGAVKPLVAYLKTKSSSCKNLRGRSANRSAVIAAPLSGSKSRSKDNSSNSPNQRVNGTAAPCPNEGEIIFKIRQSTVKALFELSKHPENCVTMHQAGVVKLLVNLVGSQDATTQEAAASCLLNIRRLAIESM